MFDELNRFVQLTDQTISYYNRYWYTIM